MRWILDQELPQAIVETLSQCGGISSAFSKVAPNGRLVCNVRGCREGIVIVDGNEKLNRGM